MHVPGLPAQTGEVDAVEGVEQRRSSINQIRTSSNEFRDRPKCFCKEFLCVALRLDDEMQYQRQMPLSMRPSDAAKHRRRKTLTGAARRFVNAAAVEQFDAALPDHPMNIATLRLRPETLAQAVFSVETEPSDCILIPIFKDSFFPVRRRAISLGRRSKGVTKIETGRRCPFPIFRQTNRLGSRVRGCTMSMPVFRNGLMLKLVYRGVSLAALATLAHPAAHAQQPGVPPFETMMERLPEVGASGLATIDIVAMSFAVLASILSLRAISGNRIKPAENVEPLSMTATSPDPHPIRSSPQQLIERICGADRPDAKSLFASGIKLLSAVDEPERLVGIAALEVVALGDDLDLAVTAMEYLADHMQDRFRHSHDGAECSATAEALSNAGLIGRSCERTLTFAAEDRREDNDERGPPVSPSRAGAWSAVSSCAAISAGASKGRSFMPVPATTMQSGATPLNWSIAQSPTTPSARPAF